MLQDIQISQELFDDIHRPRLHSVKKHPSLSIKSSTMCTSTQWQQMCMDRWLQAIFVEAALTPAKYSLLCMLAFRSHVCLHNGSRRKQTAVVAIKWPSVTFRAAHQSLLSIPSCLHVCTHNTQRSAAIRTDRCTHLLKHKP
jgi:hypothetical protein